MFVPLGLRQAGKGKTSQKDGIKAEPSLKTNPGFCPICEKETEFVERHEWLRDHYLCARCKSIPRNRALIHVLGMIFPDWRDAKIHESSPSGPASAKLQRECKDYTPPHFWPNVKPGDSKYGIRCENLEQMTFADNTFDLMITQDVMEHILNPVKSFSDIARILKPGGAHVFTVPYYYWKPTLIRAVETPDGIKYLEEKQFHGNPVDKEGSLVVTEWGPDFVDRIYRESKMTTAIYHIKDRSLGIDGKFLEVFVSRKPL
ncbi:MAG: class I SAM-dependent methyltransferase [Deltaproteobacteria bacterium]|nr:class I SAM-dependent methyltransferase [Deltaproteobacteria bacterium]